jgi:hypothetical protein
VGTVRIYDLSGRLVRILIDGVRGPLSLGLRWDLLNDRGRRAAPGIYFARLEAGAVTANRKLVLLGD